MYPVKPESNKIVHNYVLSSRCFNGDPRPQPAGTMPDMGALEADYAGLFDENSGIVPKVCILNQNYPNPFNPSTTISFNLSANSLISLEIYNIQGQLVKSLVNERLAQGNKSYLWDGKNTSGLSVTSGIYLYKLSTDDKVQEMKKMTLLK